MDEQRDHRELHLPRADLAPEVFGRPADHLPSEEDADDQEKSRLIMPTPLPPKTQFSHMPIIGDMPESGFRLSISALIAPQVTSVVIAANAAPAEVPKRSSLPSRLPRCWSTGRAATAGLGTSSLPLGAEADGTC